MSFKDSDADRVAFRERLSSRLPSRKLVIVGIPTLYMLVLFVLAIALMFVISFWRSEQFQIFIDWNIHNYVEILTSPSYHTLLFRSFVMALSVTIFSLLVGYPIAYYISKGLDDQQLPVLLLFAAPFFVGAMLRESAHQAIIGPAGLANQLMQTIGVGSLDIFNYGLFQVFVGEVYLWFPFMMLSIFLSLELIDERLLEAAVDAGATPWVAFREVVWPLSLPGVTIGSILVFVSSFVSTIPSRFVGGASGTLIGNTLKGLFGEAGNWPQGAALGVVIIVIALLFVGSISIYTLRKVPTVIGGDPE